MNLIGNKYGFLTVIEKSQNRNGKVYWLCRCDCSNIKEIRSDSLTSGKISTCNNNCPYRKINKLKTDTFGKLTVLERVENKSGDEHLWLCLCSCGNQVVFRGDRLLRGKTLDCGCVRKENGKNKYDLSGYYGIGYTKNREEFYFDLEDYDLIKKYTWCLSDGYVVTSKNNKILQLHRLILDSYDGPKKIDHKNRIRCDNRKENLRLVNDYENVRNSSVSKNNTSGIIGVTREKRKSKWSSQIVYNYKQMFLGYYENFEDAVIARLKAEKEYFGEFAPQRDLFEKYGIT